MLTSTATATTATAFAFTAFAAFSARCAVFCLSGVAATFFSAGRWCYVVVAFAIDFCVAFSGARLITVATTTATAATAAAFAGFTALAVLCAGAAFRAWQRVDKALLLRRVWCSLAVDGFFRARGTRIARTTATLCASFTTTFWPQTTLV